MQLVAGALGGWFSSTRSSLPLTQHALNIMTLLVSVPVLSVKMCSTQPSSSLSSEQLTLAVRLLSSWYMPRSHEMKKPCPNLTMSIVTSNEMGMKLVKMMT